MLLQECQRRNGHIQHDFGNPGESGVEWQPIWIFQRREGAGTRAKQSNVSLSSARGHRSRSIYLPPMAWPWAGCGWTIRTSAFVVALNVPPTPWAFSPSQETPGHLGTFCSAFHMNLSCSWLCHRCFLMLSRAAMTECCHLRKAREPSAWLLQTETTSAAPGGLHTGHLVPPPHSVLPQGSDLSGVQSGLPKCFIERGARGVHMHTVSMSLLTSMLFYK